MGESYFILMEIKCTNCGESLSASQIRQLQETGEIYCSNCGYPIRGTTIHINPDSNKKNSRKESKKQSKKWKFSFHKKFSRDSEQSAHSSSNYTSRSSWSRSNSYLRSENPPDLEGRYGYFSRMNLSSIILGFIHTSILALIILLRLIPRLETVSDFWRVLIDSLIPVLVGLAIVAYDLFYASRKIQQRDLKNYGIDFIFFGLLGTIFGWFMGIYLFIKGLFVMIIALTDSAVFAWRYNKSFSEVLTSFTNSFAAGLGFIILLLTNPFLKQPQPIQYTYFYIALGCLIGDFLVLRYLVNQYQFGEVPIWIGILKLILGVAACFHYFAGIMLVIEGFIIVVVQIFKYDSQGF